jgi:hypothetical protein
LAGVEGGRADGGESAGAAWASQEVTPTSEDEDAMANVTVYTNIG